MADEQFDDSVPFPSGALSQTNEARVDTWLWATRQTKTRSMATTAARAGHVRVNGVTAKAAQKIRVGDEVRLRIQGFDRIFKVNKLVTKRVGAPQAQRCFTDNSPERPQAPLSFAIRERGAGRPTKKERRELDKLRGRDSHIRSARSEKPPCEDFLLP